MSSWKFGIVRHYDDEKGRGFITELSQSTAEHGANNNTTAVFLNDYFVVESSIKQYMPTVHRHKKRLITGEYVQFLIDPRHTPHGMQKKRVVCVCGIFGGPLIFEQGNLRFETYTRINQTMYPPRATEPTEDTAQITGTIEGIELDSDVAIDFVGNNEASERKMV